MIPCNHIDTEKRINRHDDLRSKGQFWTPEWVAEFMVAYVLQGRPHRLFDPAVGEGIFFRTARRFAEIHDIELEISGCEIDPNTLHRAKLSGVSETDCQNIEIRDFVLDPPKDKFPAIVANPPYIRHQRLSPPQKAALQHLAREVVGKRIDGRAGLHIYFLIRALQLLEPKGRLSFIVSADTCEGVFAKTLWQWIVSHYCLDLVLTFDAEATPFPSIDTNPVVLCIRNDNPTPDFTWARCHRRNVDELALLITGSKSDNFTTLDVYTRRIDEGLSTGFSRLPFIKDSKFTLGDFAEVKRGIATGDNSYFFMTQRRAHDLGLPTEMLVPAIGRTRDINGNCVTVEDLERLEELGRPTRLLHINGVLFSDLPLSVRSYLNYGESRGIPEKPLIRTRKPWYKMETRRVPPILFAYLGRRNARFIRNYAGVVPLTAFLCVYPRHPSEQFVDRLWRVLCNSQTIANLRMVGKSYGGEAIKVEPRSLERLPLPEQVVRAEGLDQFAPSKQGSLFDEGV